MRKSLINILALVVLSSSFSFAQFQDPDHYYLTDVKVLYNNYLRDSTANPSWAGGNDTTLSAVWDSNYVTKLQMHWPNKAYALAGSGTSQDIVAADSLGELFYIIETDDSLLTTASLENYGVMLHIQLNADGSSSIPPTGYTATYPTFRDTLCITIPTVPTVDDAPVLDWTGPEEMTDSDLYGWGVLNSDVFDWFEALTFNSTTGEIDSVKPANWGLVEAYYDDAGTAYDSLNFEWYAMDGRWQDGGGDAGYDDDSTSNTFGELDRILGVRLTGDTSTIAATAAALTLMQTYGLVDTSIEAINVSTSYPMLGGKGQAADADGDGDNDDIILPPALGGSLTHAYYFNPTGDDGELFSGDEAFASTGYYFTKNFLDAAGGFGYAFTVAMTVAPTAGDSAWFWAGADSVYRAFGVADAYAAIYAASTAGTMSGLVSSLVLYGEAYTDAVATIAAAGPVYTLGTLAAVGVDVNDSDHDMDLYIGGTNTDGRLIFELDDSPACFPIYQARSVDGTFVKYSLLEVDSDLSNVPMKFEVHDNYPNPFNPVTTIRFDLAEANRTKVTVWNILGQHVNTLYVGDLQAGSHKLHFNGMDRSGQALASGVYFYKVESGQFTATKKMMMLK